MLGAGRSSLLGYQWEQVRSSRTVFDAGDQVQSPTVPKEGIDRTGCTWEDRGQHVRG